jgi:atypical dual specificity phosphatase
MDTWWIDNPHLLGSRNPTLADLEQLRRDGFEVLISLLKEDEQSPRYDVARAVTLGFRRYNIPVKDFCPPTVAQIEHFLSLIGDARGAKTIVHCEGGIGRTGTFAAAYWVAKGLKVSDAIAHVREARRHAVETQEQEAALRAFATKRRGSC